MHRIMAMWITLQIVAIVAGYLLVVRASSLRATLPFALAVVVGAIGAVVLGTGPSLIVWKLHGSNGAPPDLEIAGFGALAGIVLAFIVVAPRFRISPNAIAPALGAMIALSRIGCFVAGCEFGTPTSLPWAVRYPVDSHAWREQVAARLIPGTATSSLAVHPVQLYEAALGLAILTGTFVFFEKKRFSGALRFAVIAYAAGRYAFDFVRGDLRHDSYGFTPSQWLALAAIVFMMTISVRPEAPSSSASRPSCSPTA